MTRLGIRVQEMRDVPVLVTAFKRPDLTRDLLMRLRAFRPSLLFFAVDGPRSGNAQDMFLVEETIASLKVVDWPTTVHTLFRDENLGCGLAMSGAISWFFQHVDEGIILEDDIRPTADFFRYCSSQLDERRSDARVISISSATSVPLNQLSTSSPVRLSRFPQVWGWATWANRWEDYKFDISDWSKRWRWSDRVASLGMNPLAWAVWQRNFSRVASGKLDTWDYQLVLLALASNQFTVVPKVSLVENVGWGPDATHTRSTPKIRLTRGAIPSSWSGHSLELDPRADAWTLRHTYGAWPPRMLPKHRLSTRKSHVGCV